MRSCLTKELLVA